jgi:hypothetical protein
MNEARGGWTSRRSTQQCYIVMWPAVIEVIKESQLVTHQDS